MNSKSRKVQGFSMLELLVALVVSLVTLMGAAGLVVRTVQQEVESHQRIQALTFAQDMIDRININRRVVSCYSNGVNGMTVGKGVVAANLPACGAGTATQNARADADVDAWHDALLGISERNKDDANIGSMIDARGCINLVNAASQTYRVTVVWQGMSDTVAPSSACGQGQYSAEPRRRAISLLVQIGDLS